MSILPEKNALNPRDEIFVSAIVLAGGKGKRMGREKQFIPLNSKPMVLWSVEKFLPLVDELILVLNKENIQKGVRLLSKVKKVKFASAGTTRIKSLESGYRQLSPDSRVVAVHDGGRPLVLRNLISSCLNAALDYGAAVPAVKIKDTVKKIDGDFVMETLDRDSFVAAQTPQCYRREIFDKIFSKRLDADYSDESQILEKAGVKIRIVCSDYKNIKITTREDIIMAEAFMNKKRKKKKKKMRFGFGYDIHRLIEGRPFIIAGEKIKYKKGMLGHSDGDVVIHAICDALLGSIAAGEIGVYFPPTDLTIMGISSRVIAEKVLEIFKTRGAKIIQIDATIVAENPKIKPHYTQMRKNIAEIFQLDIGDVSIKAKSREGLGDIGQGEAVSCYAVCSVEA